MRESDKQYFERRATEERAAAGRAMHPDARRAHLDMAGRYTEAAAAIGEADVLQFFTHGHQSHSLGN